MGFRLLELLNTEKPQYTVTIVLQIIINNVNSNENS